MNTKKKIAVSLVSAVSSGVILALGAVIFLLADSLLLKGITLAVAFSLIATASLEVFPTNSRELFTKDWYCYLLTLAVQLVMVYLVALAVKTTVIGARLTAAAVRLSENNFAALIRRVSSSGSITKPLILGYFVPFLSALLCGAAFSFASIELDGGSKVAKIALASLSAFVVGVSGLCYLPIELFALSLSAGVGGNMVFGYLVAVLLGNAFGAFIIPTLAKLKNYLCNYQPKPKPITDKPERRVYLSILADEKKELAKPTADLTQLAQGTIELGGVIQMSGATLQQPQQQSDKDENNSTEFNAIEPNASQVEVAESDELPVEKVRNEEIEQTHSDEQNSK